MSSTNCGGLVFADNTCSGNIQLSITNTRIGIRI